ncbi:MAG: hypothetical protein QM753_18865 [Thermomicrobiales bacterium]
MSGKPEIVRPRLPGGFGRRAVGGVGDDVRFVEREALKVAPTAGSPGGIPSVGHQVGQCLPIPGEHVDTIVGGSEERRAVVRDRLTVPERADVDRRERLCRPSEQIHDRVSLHLIRHIVPVEEHVVGHHQANFPGLRQRDRGGLPRLQIDQHDRRILGIGADGSVVTVVRIDCEMADRGSW